MWCLVFEIKILSLRKISCVTPRLHIRVGVAKRTSQSIHIILHNGLTLSKLHNRHRISNRGRNGCLADSEAGVVG